MKVSILSEKRLNRIFISAAWVASTRLPVIQGGKTGRRG